MIENLSLPETAGTFTGFLIQQSIASYVVGIGAVIIGVSTLIIAGGNITRAGFYSALPRLIPYWVISALVLSSMIAVGGTSTNGSDIVSAVAQSNGGSIQTAQQFRSTAGLTPHTLNIAPMPFKLVQEVSAKWMRIGTLLNEDTVRPGSTVYPIKTFVTYNLPGTLQLEIENWVDKCIGPAQVQLAQSEGEVAPADLLPFPGSALHAIMAGMETSGERILNLITIRRTCGEWGDEIESRALANIASISTPAGTPLADLWQDELNVPPEEAARLQIMRVVQAAGGGDGPPIGLIGKYVGFRVASRAAGVGKNLFSGSWFKALGSALGAEAFSEAQRLFDRLSGVVGLAIFFATFFPMFLGIGQAVVVGLLPVVVLWSLASPGHQLRPIGIWLGALIVVYSGPAVMGITELLVDLYADGAPFSLQNPVDWVTTQVGILLLQASGPVVFLVLASVVTLSGVGIARLGRML
jgi:hypothetical protein